MTALSHTLNSCFDWLPVSALVEGDILCIHGGISTSINVLSDLPDIPTPSRRATTIALRT
jgi:serine/threonine-protein phosphatase PP1 catalytic subunit